MTILMQLKAKDMHSGSKIQVKTCCAMALAKSALARHCPTPLPITFGQLHTIQSSSISLAYYVPSNSLLARASVFLAVEELLVPSFFRA